MKLRCLFCFSFVILSSLTASFKAIAFTGTYGINYGRIADNIPSPEKVAQLLREIKIKNVRIYDFDHSVLQAFSGTGLELVVGLPNGYVQEMSTNADHAMDWVKDNIQSFLPGTNIVGIAVGNEVLGGSSYLSEYLLGAVKNIYNATKTLKLEKKIQITTAHSSAVFNNSYPPSSGNFKESVNQYMKPLLEFFSQINSPFCLNAYPFLAYMSDPDQIDINYALFQKNSGISDPKTNLHYDNMLDAIIDAAYAALEDAGYKKMEVIITETGWASKGDQNEAAATLQNARTYNYNLRKRLALRKGTPLRPHILVRAYIFALFNEDLKPGPTSERNFGLFKPDGTITYDIGFHGMESSAPSSLKLSIKLVDTNSLANGSPFYEVIVRGESSSFFTKLGHFWYPLVDMSYWIELECKFNPTVNTVTFEVVTCRNLVVSTGNRKNIHEKQRPMIQLSSNLQP